jgi:hypothetical protein
MGIKKNNPGCNCCGCPPLASCEGGSVIGYDVTISGFVASRTFHFSPADFTACRRYIFEGYDVFNGTYEFRQDAECDFVSVQVIEESLTTDFAATTTSGFGCPDEPNQCTGYVDQFTCPMPMKLTVQPSGIVLIVDPMIIATCSDFFGSNRIDGWTVTLNHPNMDWVCAEQTTTVNFGPGALCPSDDTTGTISLTTTPVFA